MTEPERIIDAEVVHAQPADKPERVATTRSGEIGPVRYASRGVYLSGGKLDPRAFARVRLRAALAALVSLACAAGAGWLAATTQVVVVAAVMLVLCVLLVLVAIVFGAIWRLMGRLRNLQP